MGTYMGTDMGTDIGTDIKTDSHRDRETDRHRHIHIGTNQKGNILNLFYLLFSFFPFVYKVVPV